MGASPEPTVTLLFEGWHVWSNDHGRVRVGGEFTSSVEFHPQSPLAVAEPGRRLGVEHLAECRYRVTARVLDATDAVVLDLGAFRALRGVWPGKTAGDFRAGTTVSLELLLGLDVWEGSPWVARAAELYGSEHRWRVRRIVRRTQDRDDAVQIEEATIETVDSSGQYCLLECSLVG